ncbi:hypothetical protein G9A89_006021 [Geosiphon pyriformis]|nr:hypothetical protein G9A89_006021 [Geosiphon pyriformis]
MHSLWILALTHPIRGIAPYFKTREKYTKDCLENALLGTLPFTSTADRQGREVTTCCHLNEVYTSKNCTSYGNIKASDTARIASLILSNLSRPLLHQIVRAVCRAPGNLYAVSIVFFSRRVALDVPICFLVLSAYLFSEQLKEGLLTKLCLEHQDRMKDTRYLRFFWTDLSL